MNEIDKIKKEIFRKFIYNEKLKYNEIWNKKICTSSLFDYHFKKLINDNIIEKYEDYYRLTTNGINFISNLDGVEIEVSKKPIVCSFFIAEKEGKFLFCKRNKQPFINFLGVAGGKVDFGSTTEQQVEKELFEETGLNGNSELRIITEYITTDIKEEKISHHIIGFFYHFKDVKGELNSDTREGEFMWLSKDELNKYDTFPDLEKNIDIVLNKKGIEHYVSYRKVEEGKFIEEK